MGQQTAIEIIDVPEFAKRVLMTEKEIKRAVRTGQLLPGRHYFLIGEEARFWWREELIARLEEDCILTATAPKSGDARLETLAAPSTKPISGVNKNYFAGKG